MEYQTIINLLDNTPNQPSNHQPFSIKNWIEINDDSTETYNTSSQITFKTMKLKTSVCDYSARNYVSRKHQSYASSKK